MWHQNQESVGTGEQETVAVLDSLANELSNIVDGASGEVGELQLMGFIFEPEKGNVHPIVYDRSGNGFALGGEKFNDRFQFQENGSLANVTWGGNAGELAYHRARLGDNHFKVVNQTEENKLGIELEPSEQSKAPEDESVKAQPMFVYRLDQPSVEKNPVTQREQASRVLEFTLKGMRGQKPEFLESIKRGLDKAGGGGWGKREDK
jgi:hypothetical protein